LYTVTFPPFWLLNFMTIVWLPGATFGNTKTVVRESCADTDPKFRFGSIGLFPSSVALTNIQVLAVVMTAANVTTTQPGTEPP
jgi:hypothetical protein